jgi:hypothetical protein
MGSSASTAKSYQSNNDESNKSVHKLRIAVMILMLTKPMKLPE